MKLSVDRGPLLKSLSHVQRVVERRNTYPILANVLFRTGDGQIEVRATDLDIEITESVPATILQSGSTTVAAHKMYDVVRKLADGAEIKLEANDETMQLASGRSRFNLGCLSPDSFPDLRSGTFSSTFVLPAPTLKDLLDRTAFAMSNDETRYYLGGIYFHVFERDGANFMRAVATDGHRLARTEISAPAGSPGMPSIIVPRKTVNELQKLLEGMSEDVQVEVSETKIRVTAGNVILLSKLVEGTFPDYDRVTPKHNDKRMAVDRTEFAVAVDRVSTIASDRGGKAIKLSIDENVLEFSVNNPDHGAATEELPVEFDSNGFEIGFNAKYLLDIVNQVRADTVIFMLSDSNGPALIKEGDDESSIYVLMPMRV